MKRHRVATRGVTVLAVLGLAGGLAGATGAPAVATQPDAQIQWTACPEDVPADPPQLRCTTVSVPLDYRDPDGERIDIMISRLASANPQKRRGVLLLNPGGPGGTGLTQPSLLNSLGVPAGVLDSYDLIGVDTRGVGHSAPVSCGFTTDQAYRTNIPPYAVDDAAVLTRAETAKAVAEQCAANDSEGRLRHLTTANIARDMDRIRAALGEEKASFLGYSYGTALGAAYASMFPERADRIVLDSTIGDTHLDHAGLRRYAVGMEETFPDFAKWAAARHGTYGLGRTQAEVRRTYFTLIDQLDENPVDGLDGGHFPVATFASLYKKSQYAPLAQAWQSLLAGKSTAPREPREASAPSPNDNAFTVFLAVTCNDYKWSRDIGTYRRAVAEDREKYPLFGAAAANVLPCAYWPYEQIEPPVAVDDELTGQANVLIVQHRRDPVTPLRGGQLLDEKFGERSRLVTVDGSGHGVYVLGDNACASNITTAFLVGGTMPKRDVTCRERPGR
jgi:pimeloyl-ACP methyl ester carboxylesterase